MSAPTSLFGGVKKSVFVETFPRSLALAVLQGVYSPHVLGGSESVLLLTLGLLILLLLLACLGWVHGLCLLVLVAFLFNEVLLCNEVQNLPRCQLQVGELTG